MRGIPWADDPWNEIIPGLWQGGLYYGPDARHEAIPVNEFGLVVSMHPKWDTGPAEGVPHWRCQIPDGSLNDEDRREKVDTVVARVLAAHEQGVTVLVRCQAGYNRSGLVVGLVMVGLGWTADDAIAQIRAKRSPHALGNEYFVKYIREREQQLKGAL